MTKLINLNESFPGLSKPPIVEALFAVNVIPSTKWDEISLQQELMKQFIDFPKIETINEMKVSINPASNNPPVENNGCVGLKLTSADKLHVAQFNKNGFTFSRLQPYLDWEQFKNELLRLWSSYFELLKPSEILRLGLRFINRFVVEQEEYKLADFYKSPPETLESLNWPLIGYLHHDVLRVPETPYSVNLIKAIQNVPGKEIGLILDIDVFMHTQFKYDESRIVGYLEEMRWVKNKIFFSSITDKLLEDIK